MARIPTIETTISGTILGMAFDNGQTLSLSVGQLTEEIRNAALMHGLKQKLVDAAAISRNPDTGRSATTEDKYNAVREVYDRLLSGQWNKQREGGSGGASGGLLFRALSRLYSAKTPEQIREFLEGKTDAEKATLRKLPAIAAIIEQLKAESAKTDGIDGAALLAGLENEGNE